jgi:hypothetical protein
LSICICWQLAKKSIDINRASNSAGQVDMWSRIYTICLKSVIKGTKSKKHLFGDVFIHVAGTPAGEIGFKIGDLQKAWDVFVRELVNLWDDGIEITEYIT